MPETHRCAKCGSSFDAYTLKGTLCSTCMLLEGVSDDAVPAGPGPVEDRPSQPTNPCLSSFGD